MFKVQKPPSLPLPVDDFFIQNRTKDRGNEIVFPFSGSALHKSQVSPRLLLLYFSYILLMRYLPETRSPLPRPDKATRRSYTAGP